MEGDSDHQRMHNRLIDWGLCWIRGGGGQDIISSRPEMIEVEPREDGADVNPADCRILMSKYRDPHPDYERQFWSPSELRAAELLHSNVIRLSLVAYRMVLQVFYGESCAVVWQELQPNEREKIIRDLTSWTGQPLGVNARIAHYNRVCFDHVPPIHASHFESIRHRAIRELVARERGTPTP